MNVRVGDVATFNFNQTKHMVGILVRRVGKWYLFLRSDGKIVDYLKGEFEIIINRKNYL